MPQGLPLSALTIFYSPLFPFLLFVMSLLGYLPFSSDDVIGLIRRIHSGGCGRVVGGNAQQFA